MLVSLLKGILSSGNKIWRRPPGAAQLNRLWLPVGEPPLQEQRVLCLASASSMNIGFAELFDIRYGRRVVAHDVDHA
jgi:hypothetical protein